MVWYSHLLKKFPQFIVIHTVKGFGIVNKEEIDIFLELSCFFNDPADVGNLISGSSAFSKTSLNNWKFTVHVLLKPGIPNKHVVKAKVANAAEKWETKQAGSWGPQPLPLRLAILYLIHLGPMEDTISTKSCQSFSHKC